MFSSRALRTLCRRPSLRLGTMHTRLPRATCRYMATVHTLDYEAGPLVWIDCEMTGLDPRRDRILEIAVIITNGKLELADNGVNYVIKTEKDVLDRMGEWCTRQHAQSGLTEACLTSPNTHADVNRAVLSYIKSRIPTPRVGVLAGNSVHTDRAFLAEHMPEILDWLHYRVVDVSSFKEIARRWHPSHFQQRPALPLSSHRAMDDIVASILELMWYRDHIFIPPESTARCEEQGS